MSNRSAVSIRISELRWLLQEAKKSPALLTRTIKERLAHLEARERARATGSAPYVPGRETSKQAAEDIEPMLGPIQRRVLARIVEMGDVGATDSELHVHFGDLDLRTVSARRIELMKRGKVVDSGKRRRTRANREAIVWVARNGDMP